MTLVKDVMQFLDKWAAPEYAESYDNPGLICGDPNAEVRGVLTCMDCTEEMVDEAIQNNCNLIVAHHPIIFQPLAALTGKNYVERTVIKAIRNEVNIFAAHTNLDSVYHKGVSTRAAEIMGLEQVKILAPKAVLTQVEVEVLKMRVDDAYEIAVRTTQQPFFRSMQVESEEGERFVLLWEGPSDQASRLQNALAEHGISSKRSDLHRNSEKVGLGAIGELGVPLPEEQFLTQLKNDFKLKFLRHTPLLGKSIQKVAFCGGAGSFLLSKAMAAGADIFITGDFKYHEFFDADRKIVIADIGHYESERHTIDLLKNEIQEKFSTFAVRSTKLDTNPVNYF